MATNELARAPSLALLALLIFVSSLACVGLEETETSECVPACGIGTVCQAGVCVDEEEALACSPACAAGERCQGGACVPGDTPPPTDSDIGRACAPEMQGECDGECVELSDGSGICTARCGASGSASCPSPLACGQWTDASGALVEMCLPNASCGELTYQGGCQGDTLRYCGLEGPVEVNCAGRMGEDGAAMRCDEVNPEHGYDCVSADFSGGCGAETTAGRCEGDTLIRCQSQATGEVERITCSDGQECGVGSDGSAGCRLPGSQGCGAVTYEGYCEGTTAVWCDTDETEIKQYDCDQDAKTCDWVSEELGYWCQEEAMATGGSGDSSVSGQFFYEERTLTRSGLGATQERPVRRALVQVRRASDDATLASQYTDAQGRYEIRYEASSEVYVAALTVASTDRYAVSVRDCPLADCGGIGNVYGATSSTFTPEADKDLGRLVVPASGLAGAFNIFDVFIEGIDFAWAQFGQRPPALVGQWAPGSDTACGTSCYSSYGGHTVYILGVAQDTDEFDDPVLGHEFGHFLESAFSRSDSPGGAHDGSPTDPLLAWGEGYGTYVGSVIFGSPVYIDSRASGASVTDIRDTGYTANPSSSRQMNQLVSEYVVAEGLWTIGAGGPSTPALGHDAIFDVLHAYFPSSRLVDRGVSGVDLVDFLDGWFCRGHQREAAIYQIITSDLGFPYDYREVDSCR